ncbi:Gamma-tubulin complex component 3, partial [Halocaridina rubra]
MDASGNLLRRLCCHVTGIDDQRVERYFLLAVNLLNESWNGPPVKDHTSAGDKIKRRLVREKRMEDATRFSCLLNKLVRSDVLHNKGSILMLFFALNNNKLYTARSKIRTSNAGLTNSHKEDTFPLPKLLLPERQKSVSSSADNADQNSKHNSLEKREGSNRVWNLAERYKAAATAQPNSPFAELQQLHKTSSRSMADKLPLSSSVNKHPSKLGASEEITEKELIREVLFIFQGVDGKIIKLDCSKDGYTIDPKIRLSQTQNEVLMKLVGVGWLYKRVNSFCEHGGSIQGSERTADRMVSGLVHQALVTVLKEHLIEYRRLIAVLDTQIQEGGDTPLGEVSEGLTLIKLFMWIWEPRCRLKTLALLADSARQEHGGSCISNLYQYLRHGDPGRRKVVSHILSHSSQPIYVMLTQWLLEGTLQDPHLEFFIVADPLVPDDRLWHDKYSIRWTMLPSFISKSQAQQILASGKSLNFLRNVCQCQGPISGRDVIKRALQQTS